MKISDNMPLKKAIELIDKGNNIFITGGGGVGKSYILKALKEHYENLEITSTTGVSAINVGGQTIHSWAGIGIANKSVNYVVKYKICANKSLEKNIRECKLLAIDEISMMSDKSLKYLDEVLQKVRNCNKVFGGLQVILIGDFFQIPPVKNNENPDIDYCFNSLTWYKLNLSTIYLKEVKRQSDKKYIEALNNIRVGNITQETCELFKSRNYPADYEFDKNILQIFAKNDAANEHNKKCFEELTTKEYKYLSKDTFYTYNPEDGKCNSSILIEYDNNEKVINRDDVDIYIVNSFNRECRAPQKLVLKEGCRVMLLKNLSVSEGYVNGLCGTVKTLTNNSIEVLFDNGKIKSISPVTFDYIQEGKTKIKRQQYPLMLAYAINNHKSQGMTFDKLVVNFRNIFGDGMGYVVLSRTRTLDGLFIKGFDCKKIQTSQKVIQFYNDIERSANCYIFDGNNSTTSLSDDSFSNDDSSEDVVESQNTDERYNALLKELQAYKLAKEFNATVEECAEMLESYDYEEIREEFIRACSQNADKTDSENTIAEDSECDDEYGNEEELQENTEELTEEQQSTFAQAFAKYNQKKYDEALSLFKQCINENWQNDMAFYYIGSIYEIKKDYKNAIENYNIAIKLNPDKLMYLDARANTYYDDEQYAKSVNDWNNLLLSDNEYNIDYSTKGVAEYMIEEYQDAIEDFTKSLVNNQEDSELYYCIGVCKYYLNDYESAIKEYSYAIKLDSEQAKYFNERATAYYKNRNYKEAVDDWNKVLEIDSEYDIDYYYKGDSNYEIKNYKDAITDYDKYLKNNPDDDNAYYNSGICKYCLNDYEGAIEDYTKALQIEPDYYNYIEARADAYAANKQFNQSIDDLSKLIQMYPESPEPLDKRAITYYNAQEYENAVEDWINMTEVDPYYYSTFLNELHCDNAVYLAVTANKHYCNKEYEEAIEKWNKVRELEPDFIDLYKFAYAEYKIGEYDDAQEDYSVYIENNPKDDTAYNNRGLCKMYSEKYLYEDAIEDYNIALKLNPENAAYLNNRANAYYLNQEYENALADWKTIISLEPFFAKINYLYLANTEYKLGKYKDAIEYYTLYLTNNSEDCKVYNLRGICRYKLNDFDGAFDDFNQAINYDTENNSKYFENRTAAYQKKEGF